MQSYTVYVHGSGQPYVPYTHCVCPYVRNLGRGIGLAKIRINTPYTCGCTVDNPCGEDRIYGVYVGSELYIYGVCIGYS